MYGDGVANIVIDTNSQTRLRCYPRGNFYLLIVSYSTLNKRVIITHGPSTVRGYSDMGGDRNVVQGLSE